MKEPEFTNSRREAKERIGCSQVFSFLGKYIKLIFSKKETSYYDSKVERTIMMKTWLCHTAYSIVKLLNWVVGRSHWLNVPAPPC